jgi:hypothetical protein
MHMQQRTAVVLQHATVIVHDNRTATIKMYSWTEWLAWLCLLSNARMQQRTNVLQHTNQLLYMITCAATSKIIWLDEWLAWLCFQQCTHAAATYCSTWRTVSCT